MHGIDFLEWDDAFRTCFLGHFGQKCVPMSIDLLLLLQVLLLK